MGPVATRSSCPLAGALSSRVKPMMGPTQRSASAAIQVWARARLASPSFAPLMCATALVYLASGAHHLHALSGRGCELGSRSTRAYTGTPNNRVESTTRIPTHDFLFAVLLVCDSCRACSLMLSLCVGRGLESLLAVLTIRWFVGCVVFLLSCHAWH